jgi:hypothetical protein
MQDEVVFNICTLQQQLHECSPAGEAVPAKIPTFKNNAQQFLKEAYGVTLQLRSRRA